jgi:glutathione synthase/RimK-type ligase-like ATP-grasp enzyme
VIKVESQQALLKATAELFEHSVLLLAQEFFYTEYDWRIGVLNRKPIFACQYFMSKGHRQIYNHKAKGQDINGECRTLAVHEAPRAVVVIEVNDNPNMDAGIEDAYLQDDLYSLVLKEFVRRLELKCRGQA